MFGQQFQPSPAALSSDPFAMGDNSEDPFKTTPKPAMGGADPFKGSAPDGKDPFTFSGNSFGGATVSSGVGVTCEGDVCEGDM